MPTVIDAFTVSLGLDPSGFVKGQKAASTAFGKTREEAVKTGRQIESASEKAAESLEKIARNALKLFAIFTAGRAVKDFAADITGVDSALGRLATRIGQSPSDVSAFGNAVERMGGNAATAQSSLEKFTDQMAVLKRSGQYGGFDEISRLIGRSGVGINLFNKDATQTLGQISDALKSVNDKYGAVEAYSFGKGLGFDEGTIALLIKGSAAMRAATEESKRLGVANKADTDAAQNFQTSIRTLEQAMTSLGRSVMTQVTPTLVDLLKYFQDLITANRDWIQTNIVDKVRDFATWLKSIDWTAIVDGVKEFAKGADSVAKNLGGWKVAAEAFFALWAASKMAALFAPLFGQIALLRATLIGMGPIGWGLLGLGTLAGALVANADKGIVSGGRPSGVGNTGSIGALPGYDGGDGDRGGAGIRRRGARGAARRGAGIEAGISGATGVGRGATTAEGKENVASWLEFFQRPKNKGGMGLSAEKADAMVAMMQGESGTNLNPRAYNPNDNGGPSGGSAQWHNERLYRLKAFADKLGKPWTDRGVQQQFWKHEAETTHKGVFSRIEAAKDGAHALGEGVAGFEVPSNIPGETRKRMQNYNRLQRDRAAAKPTAFNGIPAASAFVEQAKMAQAANAARVSNDNRSTIDQSSQTTIGDVHVHTTSDNADGISRDMQGALQRRSFAMSANYGQA